VSWLPMIMQHEVSTICVLRVVHGLGRFMGWVGSNFLDWVGLGRVVLMFIFEVGIILQHKKCILSLNSPD